MKTYNLQETANFLKVHAETVSRLAKTGQLPGAKIGRSWVFLEDDLITYLREQIQAQASEREVESEVLATTDNTNSSADMRTRWRRRVFMDV